MRSSDYEHLLAAQEFVVQKLRQRAKWKAVVEHLLQFDIAARNRISHHHQIGPRFEIVRVKRLRQ